MYEIEHGVVYKTERVTHPVEKCKKCGCDPEIAYSANGSNLIIRCKECGAFVKARLLDLNRDEEAIISLDLVPRWNKGEFDDDGGDGESKMKLNENTKITMSISQLKRLIRESEAEDNYVYIPLGLTSNKKAAQKVRPDIKGNPSPWSIVENLYGQLSDGKWENSRSMEKWWRPARLTEKNGELCLKVKPGAVEMGWNGRYNDYLENPYVNFEGRFDAMKIREWIANHLKSIVKDEISLSEWRRDNQRELQYFDNGTTVAMVYAVYDILKNRPDRNKNVWFDAFHA